MTYGEEFSPMGADSTAPPPPPGSILLGSIVLTPTIQGVLIALAGVAVAGLIAWKLLVPELQRHEELETANRDKQSQIEQKKARLAKIEEAKANLQRAEQEKSDVLSLLAQEEGLDTLLLDVNKTIVKSGAQLKMFKPVDKPTNGWIFGLDGQAAAAAKPAATPTPAASPAAGSPPAAGATTGPNYQLSQAVTGKTIAIELEGNFQQTATLLKNLERSQQLLLLGDFSSDVDSQSEQFLVNQAGKITGSAEPNIKTKFDLIAVVPLPPEQLKALAGQPSPTPTPGASPSPAPK